MLRAKRVALIDGPIDSAHPALASASITLAGNPGASSPEVLAHATAVASVLVGSGPEMLGLCREASVLGYSAALASDPSRAGVDVVEALSATIDDAITQRVNVILIPLVLDATLTLRTDLGRLRKTLDRAASEGVAIIASGTNDATSGRAHGGTWELFAPVMPVYGVSRRGELMSRSSEVAAGRARGMVAPGEDIPTAVAGAGASLRSGSSFATAIVAGVFLALAARLAPGDPEIAVTTLALARCLVLQNRRAEAESLFAESATRFAANRFRQREAEEARAFLASWQKRWSRGRGEGGGGAEE